MLNCNNFSIINVKNGIVYSVQKENVENSEIQYQDLHPNLEVFSSPYFQFTPLCESCINDIINYKFNLFEEFIELIKYNDLYTLSLSYKCLTEHKSKDNISLKKCQDLITEIERGLDKFKNDTNIILSFVNKINSKNFKEFVIKIDDDYKFTIIVRNGKLYIIQKETSNGIAILYRTIEKEEFYFFNLYQYLIEKMAVEDPELLNSLIISVKENDGNALAFVESRIYSMESKLDFNVYNKLNEELNKYCMKYKNDPRVYTRNGFIWE